MVCRQTLGLTYLMLWLREMYCRKTAPITGLRADSVSSNDQNTSFELLGWKKSFNVKTFCGNFRDKMFF